jgi:hypothetical protein
VYDGICKGFSDGFVLWCISKSTLANWEQNGIIAPLPLGGRRKIYSMRAVLNAEQYGLVKVA